MLRKENNLNSFQIGEASCSHESHHNWMESRSFWSLILFGLTFSPISMSLPYFIKVDIRVCPLVDYIWQAGKSTQSNEESSPYKWEKRCWRDSEYWGKEKYNRNVLKFLLYWGKFNINKMYHHNESKNK